mmetsp:Transcript_43367/g.137951  ORF Transcript_43367/g.137951 Transcript_43367/m.137951 type:complete len:158 (+) Transcript_43367:125-598(+)
MPAEVQARARPPSLDFGGGSPEGYAARAIFSPTQNPAKVLLSPSQRPVVASPHYKVSVPAEAVIVRCPHPQQSPSARLVSAPQPPGATACLPPPYSPSARKLMGAAVPPRATAQATAFSSLGCPLPLKSPSARGLAQGHVVSPTHKACWTSMIFRKG